MRLSVRWELLISPLLLIVLLWSFDRDTFLLGQPGPADPAVVPIAIVATQYPTLQAALDAVPITGGVVQIPPGTYRISEPLIVNTERTRISGAGAATHIINDNQDGQPAIVIRHDDHEAANQKLWQIQLDNFRVTGNENSGPGIHAIKINEIYLEGLTVSFHGGAGIFLDRCYEDPRVADCLLTYNKQAGLEINAGHDIVVNANQFEENQDGLFCYDGFNLTCNGNNFDDHLGHGIVIENTYGSVLSGNMIEECNGWAIILDRDCYGITISANVIAHDFAGGIDLRDAWGCAVSANTFTLVHHAGVRVGPDSGRINISANTFANSEIGGSLKRIIEHEQLAQLDVANGVLLEQTSDILVTGNTFTGIDGSAVVCRGEECSRILIQNNLVSDFGRRDEAVNDPFALPASAEITVHENLIGPARVPRADR